MTNDKLFLKCKICGEELCMGNQHSNDGWHVYHYGNLLQAERLEEFYNRHKDCFMQDIHNFEISYEDEKNLPKGLKKGRIAMSYDDYMRNDSLDIKTKVFLDSLCLFSIHGYENVSVGTLAKSIGVKTSAIYYSGGKEGLLDKCYDYYCAHRHDARLTREQYEPILRNGTKDQIFEALNYPFPDSIFEPMLQCLTIVLSRLYIDSRAKEIYADGISLSMDYMQEFFQLGIEIGRFHEFNVSAVSLMGISFRLFTGQSVSIKPEQKEKWRDEEINIFSELAKLIPFKY